MKVTFLQDHQSQLSGNSFYSAGTRADFPNGQGLVDLSVAYEGWGAPSPTVFDAVVEIASSVDWTEVKGVSTEIADALLYIGLDSKEALLAFCVEGGIEALTQIPAVGMKRARDLIAFAQRE